MSGWDGRCDVVGCDEWASLTQPVVLGFCGHALCLRHEFGWKRPTFVCPACAAVPSPA